MLKSGCATITVKASATKHYKAASKSVKVKLLGTAKDQKINISTSVFTKNSDGTYTPKIETEIDDNNKFK